MIAESVLRKAHVEDGKEKSMAEPVILEVFSDYV
jgi:hypothetical protein